MQGHAIRHKLPETQISVLRLFGATPNVGSGLPSPQSPHECQSARSKPSGDDGKPSIRAWATAALRSVTPSLRKMFLT